MSLSNNLIRWIRLFAFLMYAYSIYYRNVNETLPVNQRKKPFGKWKYLTYWDLVTKQYPPPKTKPNQTNYIL